MKTKFSFNVYGYGTVTATPEAVNYNGTSGNFWEFYGTDPVSKSDNTRLGKTFMKDRSTKNEIIEQFRLMMPTVK